MQLLGIDIGGTTTKSAMVDTASGGLVTPIHKIVTPRGFQPTEIIQIIRESATHFDYDGPIGVGFPAIVVGGQVITPPTAYASKGWEQNPIAASIEQSMRHPVTVINDADAAGIGEMQFGAGKNEGGVVMMITIGTGIGSALFFDGTLIPNLELGHIYLPGSNVIAENQASERVRHQEELDWPEWSRRLTSYFTLIERVFSPRVIIIGGEVSNEHDKFLPLIPTRAKLIPAQLRNQAGIIGAALAAAERRPLSDMLEHGRR